MAINMDERFNPDECGSDLILQALLDELQRARKQAGAHAQAMKDSCALLGLQLEVDHSRPFSDIFTRLTALENRFELHS